ncbi:MAG: CNNM domain-containing protein [Phycisphaeraceae bacterium]
MPRMTLLLVYLFIAVGVSFVCSLLEAGLLSVPRSYIALLIERNHPAGRQLEAMKKDIDRPLSAILTLNTIAHTVGAAGVGAQAARVFGEVWVGLTSAVLTLLILVLSEIIPKTLGVVHAKRLAPFTATTVRWLLFISTPIVVALEWVNRLVAGKHRKTSKLTREEVGALARLGGEQGVLIPSESRVMSNLIALRDIEVRKVMTPRKVVVALPENATVADVTKPGKPLSFARMPIYDGDIDHMTGMVTRFDIENAYREGRLNATMKELAQPLGALPEQSKVADALERFLREFAHMFQVVDEYGGTAGIITLEDAMETLLGVEIVDETDTVVDMQAYARQRQQQHQRRVEEQQQLSKDEDTDKSHEP